MRELPCRVGMPSAHFQSTSRLADEELRRAAEALAKSGLGSAFATTVRPFVEEVHFTSLGAPLRTRKPPPTASGLLAPIAAEAEASNPANRAEEGSRLKSSRHSSRASSVPSLRDVSGSEADAAGPSTRWPCAAIYEQPAAGAAASLARRDGLSTTSRVHGSFHAKAVATGDVKFINPFMNRFFDRRDNGSFYSGSSLPAPKVTQVAAVR